jgi:hypothetical protein
MKGPLSQALALLAPLSLLLGACDSPATPLVGSEPAPLLAKSGGLYRIASPMFPFYTRTEPPADVGGYGYHTDDWAAIVFYRDPTCVPTDFNLFEFYDFNFGQVFSCQPTIDGFSLHVESQGVTPPKVSNLSGGAVPIWFVPWDAEFQQAVANGSLTMIELEGMAGLVKGVATQFQEILSTVTGHPVPKINLTARGYILPGSGGGSFSYGVNWPGLTLDDVKNVKITIDQ